MIHGQTRSGERVSTVCMWIWFVYKGHTTLWSIASKNCQKKYISSNSRSIAHLIPPTFRIIRFSPSIVQCAMCLYNSCQFIFLSVFNCSIIKFWYIWRGVVAAHFYACSIGSLLSGCRTVSALLLSRFYFVFNVLLYTVVANAVRNYWTFPLVSTFGWLHISRLQMAFNGCKIRLVCNEGENKNH